LQESSLSANGRADSGSSLRRTFLATLAPDEQALLEAIFGDEVTASAEWSRTHGICTLRLSLDFTSGNVPVAVVLRFTSTTSGALGTVLTEFSAPELDEVATTTMAMATMSGLSQAVLDHGVDGATLVGEPAGAAPSEREWAFSSGGWLVGLVGGVKEILENDNRFSGTSAHDSSDLIGGPLSGVDAAGYRTASSSSIGASAPLGACLAALPPGTGVVLTARAYRLTHMRRPVEYTRTLQSWFNNAVFAGQRGFVSSVVSMDVGTINVYVAALHVEVVEPAAKPAVAKALKAQQAVAANANGTTEPGHAGVADFAVLERLWKTQPVDHDVRGKPCFERLMRVVADSRHLVDDASIVAAAADRAKAPLRVGEVAHTVIGVGNATVPAWVGECSDRATLEAVVLHAVGLEPYAASAPSASGSTDGKSTPSRGKSHGTPKQSPAPVPTKASAASSALFPPFVAEVQHGGLFT